MISTIRNMITKIKGSPSVLNGQDELRGKEKSEKK